MTRPADADRRVHVWGILRLLRAPRTVGILALALATCVLFVFLGRWQWHRHEVKVAVRDLVRTNYDAAPADLGRVLGPPATPMRAQDEWRPVVVRGVYDPATTVLARDRVQDESNGYEVLVGLRTTGGLFVVDRGWVPSGRTALRPTDVPPVPTGAVTVTARLRPWQPPSQRRAPEGQTNRISLRGYAAAADVPQAELLGAYAVLVSESPAAPSPITPVKRPDVDLGPHLAYAVQWWGFTAILLALLLVSANREAGRRALAARPGEFAPATADAATDSVPLSHPVEPSGRGRRRWERLTGSGGTVDEDAEDAEIRAARASASGPLPPQA